MYQAKRVINKIFRTAGFDLRRVRTQASPAKNYFNYYFETDETFKAIFRDGVRLSGSPHDPEVVHQRMYNAVQFLRHSLDLDGDVAECGAFRGLSSFMFCYYIRAAKPDFKGEGYHIFDSFEGLSKPGEEDAITSSAYGAVGTYCQPAGAFSGALEAVKATLRDYPTIDYHRGWIPESLVGIPERQYKFVHLDLDLYEPIKGAIEYFYPRMIRGGAVVIDEYAIPRWPGAQKAVDEFCHEHGVITPVALTTGNGVLIKK
ncbi:MAG: TylF/MycF/NovP-related O-methyltransferase [Pyrinomonadaceae bacterium]